MNDHNPFALIADIQGDLNELLNRPMPETLPILPLRGMFLFPANLAPITVRRESSSALLRHCADGKQYFGVMTQRDASVEDPREDDLYPIGVVCKVVRQISLPDGSDAVILQAHGRFRLKKLITGRRTKYLRGEIEQIKEILPGRKDKEFEAAASAVRDDLTEYLKLHGSLPEDVIATIRGIHQAAFLVNFVCTNLPFKLEEKYEMLVEDDIKKRTLMLLTVLNRELQYLRLKHDIARSAHEEMDKQQREYFLHQQAKEIQQELGQGADADVTELKQRFEDNKANIPENVQEILTKEFKKIERMNPQHGDYAVVYEYIDKTLTLPWNVTTADNLDIKNAQKQLDRDHYGLEKVKERIIEQIAVMQLAQGKENRSPILCLCGPPGVGKTSLGRSIADALGRQYVRVSLAGMHDEAEIRGHRRTYVGAMPGRIMKNMLKAKSCNPVFVLDEIDKVQGSQFHGDPQSALLEVLDPEQYKHFHDNYFDFDFDLSECLFICTANTLQGVPAPLIDRMEIINVEGYLTEEKKEIAKRHLIPKALKETHLDGHGKITFTAGAIEFIIEKYTRESGVRQLAKQIEKVLRKLAVKVVNEEEISSPISLKASDIEELLGLPPFNRDIYQGNKQVGVVTGLAWTSVGGEILFIETSLSKSKSPKLTLTGNLGDVMKESATLALEYIKAHADMLGIAEDFFEQWNVHIHVPEGATPKDGPSAGITMATSIASAVTQRRVKAHLAMTGEITLRGKVLPVGGIKEKILAAKRAGITNIIMCEDNRRNIEDIPEKYVKGLTFHYVDTVEDVLKIALI